MLPFTSDSFPLTNPPCSTAADVLKAYGQGGEQCGGGINNVFQISTNRGSMWFNFFPPPVIWIECFSRLRHPGIKYLAKRLTGTKPFLPHRLRLPSPPSTPSFWPEKQETCSIAFLIWKTLIHAGKSIQTKTNRTPIGLCGSDSLWCPSCRSSVWWNCSLSPSVAPFLHWPVGKTTGSEANNKTIFKR